MPGRKKKPFIDRKKAVSFHLVHRSQRDPLQADEDSSKFVLLQKENAKEKHDERKAEERAHGVFYDDDYDYLQHLKEVNPECVWSDPTLPFHQEQRPHVGVESSAQISRLGLPAEVFPSETEENVGLLNKAAPVSGPRLDLDPDVVAAMDEDFDFDDPNNQLEDDFILRAQGEQGDGERGLLEGDGDYEGEYGSEEDYSTDGLEDEDQDDVSDDLKTFREEETKSHFTNYSLTSSVMRRNEGLTLLDDRFEKFYEQYDDMEIGALDHDEIDGHREVTADSAIMKQVLDEYEARQQKSFLGDIRNVGKVEDGNRLQVDASDDEDEDDNLVKMTVTETKKEERWDCESILSTYSNLYNHPTTIKEPPKNKSIKLSKKTGMPLDVLPTPGPTKKQQERELHDEYTLPSVAPSRPKDKKETSEERRLRKQAVKQDRRDRRLEKKANKQAFKDEEKRQDLAMMNLKQNMQGIKIV
ncbi:protein LTV1 homolog isoform X2 [Acanthaster planci]|uniref:Protein LTV1 homolog n=1 Tax=Acanthaster planci TaxID=133434 RepID=A0A8B7YFJ0_ACAPL|nr:protein LTV1 homolog isoform X2 [Acanthaster planci]